MNIWDFEVSFVKSLFLLCPILGGTFIGGSTVTLIVPELLKAVILIDQSVGKVVVIGEE